MKTQNQEQTIFHYRGFIFIKQINQSWLVRPKRSPITILPFRTPVCQLTNAKKILDEKLYNFRNYPDVA